MLYCGDCCCKDVELVRFAVGRFIHEMMIDMISMTAEYTHHNQHRRRPNASDTGSQSQSQSQSQPQARLDTLTLMIAPQLRGRSLRELAGSTPVSSQSSMQLDPSGGGGGPRANFLTPDHKIPVPMSSTKFLLYTGHDATLVPLLVLLGVYNGKYWLTILCSKRHFILTVCVWVLVYRSVAGLQRQSLH
jgi:hypothetical protein